METVEGNSICETSLHVNNIGEILITTNKVNNSFDINNTSDLDLNLLEKKQLIEIVISLCEDNNKKII